MTPDPVRCRQAHGFWLAPGPDGRLWLFLPAGTDPADGAPLTHTRQATELEAEHWQEGRTDRLARLLAKKGLPVRVRKRWWEKLAGRLSRASDV